MKALVLTEKGQRPALLDHPNPTPAAGQVLVSLQGAALNRRDLWIVQGKYPGIAPPVVLGSDGVGVPAAGDLAGRRVVICPSVDWGPDEAVQSDNYTILGNPADGTFAEAIAVDSAALVACPEHLTDAEAAALPLAGLTAWRALVTRGQIRAGDRVLVTGIGGGVATMGLLLAMAHGAEVWVTSGSQRKLDAAVALGAAGGVRYDEEGWRAKAMAAAGGFDLVFDGAGGDGFGALVRMLNPAGRLVFYGGTCGRWPQILPQHLFFKQVSILASTMGSPAEFAAMVAFVGGHQLRPVVDRVFPLRDADAALAHLAGGTQLGKVVLDTTAV